MEKREIWELCSDTPALFANAFSWRPSWTRLGSFDEFRPFNAQHPHNIKVYPETKDSSIFDFNLLMKVKILPPTDLYYGVLPYKANGMTVSNQKFRPNRRLPCIKVFPLCARWCNELDHNKFCEHKPWVTLVKAPCKRLCFYVWCEVRRGLRSGNGPLGKFGSRANVGTR